MNLKSLICYVALGILLMSSGIVASCDSFNEDLPECRLSVKFKYDYNMEKVDAFATEVKTVTLYAFDENGNFVNQKTEQGERLATENFAMTIDLAPGEYDMITWAGLDDQSFAVPLLTPGVSKLKDLTVLTRRNIDTKATGEEGEYIVQHNLPSLFHGRVERVTLSDKPNTRAIQQLVTTNNIRIVIAQINQNPNQPVTRAINKERFSYAIYDDNGYMNYDNTLLEDNMLTYLPFVTEDSKVTTRAFGDEDAEYPAAIAEISVARLLETQTPQLEIIDQETGKQLLPGNSLIKLLGLLKEQDFIDMSLQEYMDRENRFGVMFFVDENLTMINTVIQINDWIVNINDIEL